MKMMIAAALIVALPVLVHAASAEKGKTIYAAKCQACHGEQGDGNGPMGKSLKPKATDFTDGKTMSGKTDADLTKAIKEGGKAVGKSPIMGAFGGQLKDEEIADLVAYVRTFVKK